jgi:hypothetical protein
MSDDPLDDKPAPDVAEQQRPVRFADAEEDDIPGDATGAPFEADIADVADQRRAVPIPDDQS